MAFKLRIITRNEGCGNKFQKGEMSLTLHSIFAQFSTRVVTHSKKLQYIIRQILNSPQISPRFKRRGEIWCKSQLAVPSGNATADKAKD